MDDKSKGNIYNKLVNFTNQEAPKYKVTTWLENKMKNEVDLNFHWFISYSNPFIRSDRILPL